MTSESLTGIGEVLWRLPRVRCLPAEVRLRRRIIFQRR